MNGLFAYSAVPLNSFDWPTDGATCVKRKLVYFISAAAHALGSANGMHEGIPLPLYRREGIHTSLELLLLAGAGDR